MRRLWKRRRRGSTDGSKIIRKSSVVRVRKSRETLIRRNRVAKKAKKILLQARDSRGKTPHKKIFINLNQKNRRGEGFCNYRAF